jgi:uncharacterized protein
MLNPLVEPLDLLNLAHYGHKFVGAIMLSTFKRLESSFDASSSHRDIEIDLEFGTGVDGLRFVNGTISVQFALTCQRCGKPVETTINNEVRLGIVQNIHQLGSLPENYEPLVIELASELNLRQLVEDEILLAIPDIPRHEDGQCNIDIRYLNQALDEEKPDNPFEVLSLLKKQNK